jgi:hypothetical protein
MKDWKETYKDAMYISRTPGWILTSVILFHMSCCPLVWKPCFRSIDSLIKNNFNSSFIYYYEKPKFQEDESSLKENEEELEKKPFQWIKNDPMTILFDFIFSDIKNDGYPQRKGLKNEDESKNIEDESKNMEENDQCSNNNNQDNDPIMISKNEMNNLFFIPAFTFSIIWIPSTFMKFWNPSIWYMGSSTIICITSGLTICHLLWIFSSNKRIALCLAMHLSSQYINSLWSVVVVSSSPIKFLFHRHHPSGSSGIEKMILQSICSLSMGALFFHISHQHESHSVILMNRYDQLQFYSSHFWAIVIMEAIRCFIYSPVLWFLLPDY